jgi:hypothetical protein
MAAMPGFPLRRLLAASLLVLVCAPLVDAGTGYSQSFFRASAFSTQATDYLCTAAVVQNIMNLETGQSRRSGTQQAELYRFGRAHNRFRYRSPGVDPQGVEAMLEHYLPGSDWRQVRSKSLQGVLRVAARHMRATGLPAVLFVAGGLHAWTMNGYVATRDPASGAAFRVTSVRFSGPKYPKQTARLGWFDLAPNTVRSVERLNYAYFPYRESLAFGDARATPWNGYYVAVVPWSIERNDDSGQSPSPSPVPSPAATPEPTIEATLEPPAEPIS